MKTKKDMVAMLLAGGQGSRLYVLTKEIAKPAVPFGGKYRLIDFPLSNCVNSGIDTVGVLTQYQPLALNSYIGNGQPWSLDRLNGGVYILPPYVREKEGIWYKGTANAIYQNMNFIEQFHPENVLIISGDHIYKMDYSEMLAFHMEKGADASIAVIHVPIEEAGRFGIMSADEDHLIYEFTEKPKEPKSTMASMGVYIFKWETLKKYLIEDEKNRDSQNDFGKNIIPTMIRHEEKLYAYPFYGYWKDVGTIESLWEANMDLLNKEQNINLNSKNWRIFSRNEPHPPHFVGEYAHIAESIVSEGCCIYGSLWYSVLFSGVVVKEEAKIRSSVIMKNTLIHKGADIQYAIIAEDAVIEEGAVIGDDPHHYNNLQDWGIAVVGRGAVVKKGQIVRPKEMIEPAGGFSF